MIFLFTTLILVVGVTEQDSGSIVNSILAEITMENLGIQLWKRKSGVCVLDCCMAVSGERTRDVSRCFMFVCGGS